MKIEDNLLAVTNCMFKNREHWKFVTDEQKIKYFFIINRLLSKKYPEISQLLNQKNINQVLGLDLIFEFMKSKPYPSWIWSKNDKSKNSINFNEDFEILQKSLELKSEEILFLMNNYAEECKEEIQYLKNLNKK